MNNDIELKKKMQLIEQETGIKQLGLKEKKQAIYSQTHQNIDSNTGEVISQEQFNVVKIKSREDFLKLYTDNLEFLYRLRDKETRALLYIFKHLAYSNTICISSAFKKSMEVNLDVSQPTVSRAINGLIDKKILRRIDTDELRKSYEIFGNDMFFVDPNIVGKGSFRDLEKLRQTITQEFDLKQMEYTTRVNTEMTYTDYNDVIKRINKHEVVGVEETHTDKNERVIDVTIAEKQNDDFVDAELVAPKASQTPQKEALFSEKELGLKGDDEIDKALALETKKIETLELEVKKLELIQQLVASGKYDEIKDKML